jgi:2-iminobutanoate/2-iminopropanoate deaminase
MSHAAALPAAGVLGAAATSHAVGAESASPRKVIPGSVSPNYSRAIVFDRLAFVSGVIGVKPGTRELASPDFEGQCRQVLQNLQSAVEAAGSTMARVLKCTCFLTEETDFATFNKVYVTFFPSDPPARSTVIVKALVLPGAKVEVDCVAALS